MGADRLLIVDGHHFAYRAFYAIRAMNAPDGFPTNALYGFLDAPEDRRCGPALICPETDDKIFFHFLARDSNSSGITTSMRQCAEHLDQVIADRRLSGRVGILVHYSAYSTHI